MALVKKSYIGINYRRIGRSTYKCCWCDGELLMKYPFGRFCGAFLGCKCGMRGL